MTQKEVYVSSIEIELPYTQKDVQVLEGLEVEFVKYQVMKYLNRLTEIIRFSTRRYCIKMISEKDIDIYDIEFDRKYLKEGVIPIEVLKRESYVEILLPCI